MFSDPRNDLASGVRAVATTTASLIGNSSHDPVFRPAVATAGEKFFVFQIGRGVDRGGVERCIYGPEQRHNVGIRVANAADLEVVAIYVEDLYAIFVDAGF